MKRIARCRCWAVSLETVGDPIMTVGCYCHISQQAAKELGRRPKPPGFWPLMVAALRHVPQRSGAMRRVQRS